MFSPKPSISRLQKIKAVNLLTNLSVGDPIDKQKQFVQSLRTSALDRKVSLTPHLCCFVSSGVNEQDLVCHIVRYI